jgi:hypothetical protein
MWCLPCGSTHLAFGSVHQRLKYAESSAAFGWLIDSLEQVTVLWTPDIFLCIQLPDLTVFKFDPYPRVCPNISFFCLPFYVHLIEVVSSSHMVIVYAVNFVVTLDGAS